MSMPKDDVLLAVATKKIQDRYPRMDSLQDVENRHLLTVMELTKGNQTHAAVLLDIGLRTVQRRLAKIGVERTYGK